LGPGAAGAEPALQRRNPRPRGDAYSLYAVSAPAITPASAGTNPATDLGARIRRFLPLLSVLLLAGAFWVLHRELTVHHPRDIWGAIKALPARAILLGLLFSALGYLMVPGYDALGQRYVRHWVGLRRTWFTGFIAYGFSQTLGFAWLTGGSIRFRLYSAFGLSAVEIAQVVAFAGLTVWIGVTTLAGSVLALAPRDAAEVFSLPLWAIRALGIVVLAMPLAYLAAAYFRRRPIQVFGWRIRPPHLSLALAQFAFGCADWTVAAAVLRVLLPPEVHVSFPAFLALFVIAQVAGLVSHVPGGLGVFESIIVLAFGTTVPAAELLGSLLVYRATYYVLPFLVAATSLAVYEGRERREAVSRVARTISRWVPAFAPRVLAVITFVAGAVLLVSGALPAAHGRLRLLGQLVPLSVIEASHFLGSITGVGLLILAWGIARRLDGAFHLAVVLLGGGIVASLLRGFDYEEAAILAAALLVLVPAREQFRRHASLLHEPFSGGWFIAIGVVVVSSVWLGLFAYRHVPYRDELWWQFTLRGDAPRFLRATVGAFVAAAMFGLARLMRPASGVPQAPTPDELQRVGGLIARAGRTFPNLALLGDKSFLFDPTGAAFIMYGVSGRSWVAMGDPVGDPAAFPDLAWEFRELADRYGGLTSFYQATPEQLPLYLELGLRPLKIGEEANVPLAAFNLEGGGRKGLRRAQRDVAKAGCQFEMVPREQVPEILADLKHVSDRWLGERNTREKGFSLGRFSLDYVSRFPAAVVRRDGAVVAFANVWTTESKDEISPDLMRYLPDAPDGVMEFLLVELMLWGKREGYERFNLGMAPLSGIESRALAPLWSRINALVFRHGEHFYNFQGLRRYKEKFEPDWSPRYLVAPGGLVLPRVLTDIATLISGGLRGVVTR
jgi:phosphatidylglycerol lysyltransferase